jgi:hypothetical protein
MEIDEEQMGTEGCFCIFWMFQIFLEIFSVHLSTGKESLKDTLDSVVLKLCAIRVSPALTFKMAVHVP